MTHPAPLAFALAAALALAGCGGAKEAPPPPAKPALTVTTVMPRMETWPQRLQANGSVAPWQEAIIGAEIGGLKLSEVLVNVGDVVTHGQVLARFSDDTVKNDLATQEAAVKEAEANLAQAKLNIERARALEPTGSISRQDIVGYETQAATTQARLASAKAQLAAQQLRLGYTRVVASDDGTISSRTATVGSVAGPGMELFRLIRKNRLEWRGEMRADDLALVKPGQVVDFTRADGTTFQGKVRQVGPTVDPTTRLGLVYVDLPEASRLKPGMFVTGLVVLGSAQALVVPQDAIVVRDGFHYAFRLAPGDRVNKVKLTLGRRHGDRIELVHGLKPDDRVVATGASFLNEGDLVRIVDSAAKK